jgi:hypothetical protein
MLQTNVNKIICIMSFLQSILNEYNVNIQQEIDKMPRKRIT